MITKEEAHRRAMKLWEDAQSLEWELHQLGWREASKHVYGARLRISDAMSACPSLPISEDPK